MSDLKSAIMLVHIIGLALGLGGAWITDIFLTKYVTKHSITLEKFQFVEFASKVVCYGLALLWASGIGFVAYYYFFSPEYLFNEKVWAKAFIVMILTVNGVFVHLYVLPIVRLCIGSPLLAMVSPKVAHKLTTVCVVSVLSWMFPLLLGVSKTLNFSVKAIEILGVYALTILLSLAVGHWLVSLFLRKVITKTTEQKVVLIHDAGQKDAELLSQQLLRITGIKLDLSHIEYILIANKSSKKTVMSHSNSNRFGSLVNSA
jgi:hypothetical protein